MNPWNNIPAELDERTELLIVRSLDGEISEADQIELNAILAVNPAARDLLDEYRRNDEVAAEVLRCDIERTPVRAPAPISHGRHGGWRLAVYSALITAAAVIALSFIPKILTTSTTDFPGSNRMTVRNPVAVPQNPNQQLVDYKRDANFSPMRRDVDTRRDLIGVQGDNPNVIYLFERSRTATKLAPVSGDF